MNKQAWITVGLPYCGKEVWARTMAEHYHARIVSRLLIANEMHEEINSPLHFIYWTPELFKQLTLRWEERLEFLIYKKHNIICADENLLKSERVSLVEKLKNEGYDVSYVLFDVSEKEAMYRNLERATFAIPQDEFVILIPIFNQTKVLLPKEAEELGIKFITVKIEDIHKA